MTERNAFRNRIIINPSARTKKENISITLKLEKEKRLLVQRIRTGSQGIRFKM